MHTVVASGVFDVLHPGHIHYLREARAAGDRLIVIVTSDGHARRTKRPPIHTETERAALVAAVSGVDGVVIGADPYDLRTMLDRTQPQVIALGYDQHFDEVALATECAAFGHVVEVIRIPKHAATKIATRDVIH